MRTQAEIDNLLQQAVNTYKGHKPDYYGYVGECLSLVKRWVDIIRNGTLNGTMAAPASPDGWGSGYWTNAPQMIRDLFTPQPYDPNAEYPAGSLFVTTTTHHIGILISNNPGQTSAIVFHQNADPDGSAAHTGTRPKSRIDGILVLKVTSPAPSPAPTPQPLPTGNAVHLPATVPTWAIYHEGSHYRKGTTDQKGTLLPQRYGGLTYAIKGWIGDSAVVIDTESYGRGVIWVKGTDAQFITLAPPQAPVYTPPAPPVQAPLAEKYTVITRLMAFNNADDARSHNNVQRDIEPGTYYVFSKLDKCYNLTDSNVHDRGWWINTADNAILPEPVAVTLPTPDPLPELPEVQVELKQIEWGWLNDNHSPTLYRYTGSIPTPIHNLENTEEILNLPVGAKGPVSRYTIVKGNLYLIPDSEFKKGKAFGIAESLMEAIPISNTIQPAYSPLDRDYDGDIDLNDFTEGIQDFIDYSGRFIKDIVPRVTQAKVKLSKAVDGFSKKKGK